MQKVNNTPKTRLLFIDSRSNNIFNRELRANLDFQAFKKAFELSGSDDRFVATYVLQQKDNVNDEKYENYVKFLESNFGWNVDRCIPGLQTSGNYGVQVESMQLCLTVLDMLEVENLRVDGNGDHVDADVEVVLCADHSSYLTLINKIRKTHDHVSITLVHTDHADDILTNAVDRAININNLDVARDF